MKCSTILSFSLFILLSISGFAPPGRIEAIVADSANRPIAGATVVLRNKVTRAERNAVTNAEGAFSFEGTGGKSHEIVVNAGGFASTTTPGSSPNKNGYRRSSWPLTADPNRVSPPQRQRRILLPTRAIPFQRHSRCF